MSLLAAFEMPHQVEIFQTPSAATGWVGESLTSIGTAAVWIQPTRISFAFGPPPLADADFILYITNEWLYANGTQRIKHLDLVHDGASFYRVIGEPEDMGGLREIFRIPLKKEEV